jgi:S-formylglutathione hydrolase FrmB
MRVTRRRAIAGFGAAAIGAAAAGAGARDLPLRTWYDDVTGACEPGRGSDARWVMDTLQVVDFVAAAGIRYAVAAVDGGDSYWHRRASGEDRMRMLLDEFLPLLGRRFGLRPRAIIGWSMGGYGALLAAERRPELFRAVAVSSAAIWPSYT